MHALRRIMAVCSSLLTKEQANQISAGVSAMVLGIRETTYPSWLLGFRH